jgi:HEPN domain-containing protein
MTSKKIDRRVVPRDEYAGRLKNAVERRAAMERELAVGAYDPALVLAIQAAIAACDAFTVYHRGERSASDRHQDAVEVFTHVQDVEGVAEAAKHLARLIREKSDIEYSGKPAKPKEAEALVERARRFIEFVERNLQGERAS